MTAETTAATGAADTSATNPDPNAAAATNAPTPPGSDGNTANADPNAAKPAEGKANEGGDPPPDGKPDDEGGTPETYTFEMPEGITLDQGLTDKFTPLLKEAKVPQDVAQKFATALAEHMKEQAEGAADQAEQWYQHRRAQEIAQANEEGIAAIKADKDLGGANFDKVKARIDGLLGAVGTPELRQKFDKLGLGNDPDLVRLLNAAIDYTPQDTGERPAGAGGTPPRSPASILYPNEAKR